MGTLVKYALFAITELSPIVSYIYIYIYQKKRVGKNRFMYCLPGVLSFTMRSFLSACVAQMLSGAKTKEQGTWSPLSLRHFGNRPSPGSGWHQRFGARPSSGASNSSCSFWNSTTFFMLSIAFSFANCVTVKCFSFCYIFPK